jgi:hypothetical protein
MEKRTGGRGYGATARPCGLCLLALLLSGTGLAMPAWASLAKVTKVSGEVIVRSGEEITRLTSPASCSTTAISQVKQREKEDLFNDGALCA